MDHDLNPLSPDARITLREQLLRRLARMLAELREEGFTGPEAFERLVGAEGDRPRQ